MLWFFLFFVWIWLLITIFADIFRSEISGWGKAGWTLFVIILPFLGVLIYLIANGDDMQTRAVQQASSRDQAQRDYIQSVSSSSSSADELSRFAALRDSGAITEEEFQAQKAKLLA
jgi:hypothetical protein